MRTLANILWHFPFFGFLSALATFLFGGLLVITFIASPIGFGLIELSKFLLSPFSKAMVNKKDLGSNTEQNKYWKSYGLIIRILYFPFGLILAFLVVFQVFFLFISIIGIPVAIVLAKSLSTYFNPVDKICVPVAVAHEMENRSAKEYLDNNLQKQL